MTTENMQSTMKTNERTNQKKINTAENKTEYKKKTK